MKSDTPAQNHSHRKEKFIFLMFGGAISIMLLVIGGYQLVQFTDSTSFCGRLCHKVMYPEYTAYQASPHSRVLCSECHVGSGASYLVKSKIAGVPLILTTLTNTYDRPIPTPVENLRPARETCEQCHRPGRFSGDLVRTHTTYDQDEKNTAKTDTRVLRVGGGDLQLGVPQGIHWHITANVYYLSFDSKRNQIAWVGVEQADGSMKEFVDNALSSKVTPAKIEESKRLMDCVDCHNRATHVFNSPSTLIDTAMSQGKIDPSLPFIKKKGVEALEPVNPSLEEAYGKIGAIEEYYRTSYSQIYNTKKEAVDQAITALNEIARLTTFPGMNVTWNSYPSNAGHQQTLGCFRCHGKLVATSGADKGKVIDNSCTLCHYFQIQK